MKIKAFFTVTASLFLLGLTQISVSQIIYNDVGYIPQSCQVDWTIAGLLPGTSFQADNKFYVTAYGAIPGDGLNDYDAIVAAINAAKNTSGLSIVYFPAGTYDIHSTINLSRTSTDMGFSNIVLQGDGSNQTVLRFAVGKTNNCISIYGVTSGGKYSIINNVTKGSTLLARSDVSMFNPGDWIHLCEEEFDYGGSETELVGQITKVETVNYGAGQIHIKDEASKEYKPQNTLWIRKLYPIMNVGIENLKIKRMDQDWSLQGANINFNQAVNCWLKGVESDNTTYTHLGVNRCSHIEISGNYFHHARSYGEWEIFLFKTYGTGYGMVIGYSSTNCLIENNIWKKLRHAMTIGCGANCNVFTYNYSREQDWIEGTQGADLCLHGRYPYANLFEHNIVEYIHADYSHDNNGPYNAFLRNACFNFDNQLYCQITLYDAKNTSVLGCDIMDYGGVNSIDCHGITTLAADYYCYFNGALRSHAYMDDYEPAMKWNCALADVSYHYSSRPYFLSGSYTWPTLGPAYTTVCTQSIPAVNRYFNSSLKTYINNPTVGPPTMTWSGTVTLTGDVTIPDGTLLYIASGTTVKLPQNANITCEDGGRIEANGSSSAPIRFQRSGSGAWGSVILHGDNNVFSYCVFDGGYKNVYIYSWNNIFNHCTFKEASYSGLVSPVNIPGSFKLDNCLVKDNYYGIVAAYCTADITNTTIRDNSQYGLGLLYCANNLNGQVDNPLFTNNLVVNNGTYGVKIDYASKLWLGDGTLKGNNRIENNGSDEIRLNSYWARLYAGNGSSDGGYNDIFYNSPVPSGKKYIYNLSKTYNGETYVSVTVKAENNYWGTSSGPEGGSARFYGPVDWNPYKTTSQTSGAGQSGAPTGRARSGPGDIPVLSTVLSAGMVASIGKESNSVELVDLKQQMLELRNKIKFYPDSLENARWLLNLYLLQVDMDPEDMLGERQIISGIRDEKREKLKLMHENPNNRKSAEKDSLKGAKLTAQLAGEAAMLMEIHDLTEVNNFDNALSMIDDYEKYIKNSDSKRELLSQKLHALIMKCEYKDAYKVLKKLQNEVKHSKIEDYTPPTYDIIEDFLQEQLGMEPVLSKNLHNKEKKEISLEIPERFSLEPNYPNPFNPVTTIPFSLPVEAHVRIEVYDVTGRNIEVLVDQTFEAGKHKIKFHGSSLSSGIYFIRVNMVSSKNSLNSHVFTKKVMLIK